eukprot:scaffold1385_cov115-Isochrysis_galbana.AAC.4
MSLERLGFAPRVDATGVRSGPGHILGPVEMLATSIYSGAPRSPSHAGMGKGWAQGIRPSRTQKKRRGLGTWWGGGSEREDGLRTSRGGGETEVVRAGQGGVVCHTCAGRHDRYIPPSCHRDDAHAGKGLHALEGDEGRCSSCPGYNRQRDELEFHSISAGSRRPITRFVDSGSAARVHRQRPASATQPGPEPESGLHRVWRLRRALVVEQQPARGGKASEVARLQPHEQADRDVVGQTQEKKRHRPDS